MAKKTTTQIATITEDRINELKSAALDILAYCRQQILNKHPFSGAVAMNLELIPVRDRRCATAMTDGKNIFFDIDFLSRLNQDEREFVLGHEIWHVIMMHFLRGEGKDHEVFNIATDLEVNQLLEADGFVAPADVLFPNSKHSRKCMFDLPDNLSAEEYYDLLMKNGNGSNSREEGGQGKGGKGSGKGSPCNGQFDKHYDKNEDYSEENGASEAETDKYGAKGFDKDFNVGQMKSEADERAAAEHIREAIVGAAQQIERQRGELPGFIKKIVKDLLDPKLPWKELLTAFVTSSFYNQTNWNTPNRRFAWNGTYLPSHSGEMMKIAIGIDTSGSCANDCGRFLTEINSIAKTFGNYELHLIQCDTEVKDYMVFDEGNPLEPESSGIEFKGFGGTILHPIFNYIEDNELDVDAVVVFTDGECEEFTDLDGIELPVMWVLTGSQDDHKNLGIGQQIHMDSAR